MNETILVRHALALLEHYLDMTHLGHTFYTIDEGVLAKAELKLD